MSDSPLFHKLPLVLIESHIIQCQKSNDIVSLFPFLSKVLDMVSRPAPLPHKQGDSASSPASPNLFDTLDCPGLLFCTGWSKCWVTSESSWLSDALSKVSIKATELQRVYFLI